MARRKKAKKSGETKPPAHPFLYSFKAIPAAIKGNLEAVFLVLAVCHLFFFLVLLASVAAFKSPSSGRPFGESTRPVGQTEQKVLSVAKHAVSLPAAVAFAAFTLCAWGAVLFKRRAVPRRVFRLLVIMLTPGTVIAVYTVVTAFRS